MGLFFVVDKGGEEDVFTNQVYGSDSFEGSGKGNVSDPCLGVGFSWRPLTVALARWFFQAEGFNHEESRYVLVARGKGVVAKAIERGFRMRTPFLQWGQVLRSQPVS